MAEYLQISTLLLREAFDVLLQHIEEVEGREIQVEHDYFWSIPAENIYDIYHEPRNFTIGQLSESVGHLQEFVANSEGVIPYGLVWLSDVLRAVGHVVK